MSKEKVYLTQEGLEKLQNEFDHLVNVKRKEVAEKLQKARELGDLSENAAYTAAREEQTFMEGRIAELEDLLKKVEVAEKAKAGKVVVGSTVRVHLDGEKQEFRIVGAPEADPAGGKISHESPLGQALIGKKVGDKVEVEAPVGNLKYHILEVK
ncbi:MAG: transcription elongation factor GreA [Patescibacteria group bacterium]|nr:MAG: transcription elongation factor GreA [Patescibacteria group bacterium]